MLCAENTAVWEHKEATTSVDKAYPCHHPPASFLVPVCQISQQEKGPSRAFFIRLLLNVARLSDTPRQLLTLNFEIWSLTKDQLSDCSIDRRLGEQFTSPVLIFCKSSYSLFTRNEEYCSAFLMDALYGACSGGG